MLLLPLLFACSSSPEPASGPPADGIGAPAEHTEPASAGTTEAAAAPQDAPQEPEAQVEGEEMADGSAPPEQPTAEASAAPEQSKPQDAGEVTGAHTDAAQAKASEPEAQEADGVAEAEEGAAEPDAEAAVEEAPAPSGPVSYTLTPKGSSVYVQVYKDTTTAASGLSHDHVMSAAGWTGSATWDPANPGACRLDVSVPVDKLIVDAPKMRKAVGYDTELSDGDRDTVKKNMLSKEQLNGAKYSTVSFSAKSCAVSGDTVNVTGDFTLKGTTRTITVPMTLEADADGFSAKGSFKVKGSDYGLEPFSAMLGALKNQDTVKITVRVVGS